MTEDKVREDMRDLHTLLYDNDYYLELYTAVLNHFNVSEEDILNKEVSSKVIINITNKFWMHLPDSSAIRREPFYQLCDLAELCFDEVE